MIVFREAKAFMDLYDRFNRYISQNNKNGIKAFYDKRSALNKEWWEKFYQNRKDPKKVVVMGQTLSKTFSNKLQADAFVNWCKNGTNVRILLLSPDAPEVTQVKNVGKGISYGKNDEPDKILKKKIMDTIDVLNEQVINRITDFSSRPMLRVAVKDMPFSLVSIDNDMVVTFYGLNPEADEQPTLIIKGENTKAYKSFFKEFNTLWYSNSKIPLFEDPIIKDYRKDWKTYIDLYNFDQTPPPPRQAIVFPTYECSQKCSYCMYKTARNTTKNSKKTQEVDIDAFNKILTELIAFGVNKIELSGGGEPLEHSKFNEILNIIKEKRDSNQKINFGLLTNGINLDQYDSDSLLYAFNDYIRISRFQGMDTDLSQNTNGTLSQWRRNIKKLIDSKSPNISNNTKIGIKYLLTNDNLDGFTNSIKDDLDDYDLHQIEHFRFRSARNVDVNILSKVEQEVFYLLEETKLATNYPNRISLSLQRVNYPKNFRCWISPMNVVVDPTGEIYICCNYLFDKSSKCIGNILKDSFYDIWNSEKHKKIRADIRKHNCDRNNYCNCRYAELQNQLESLTSFL